MKRLTLSIIFVTAILCISSSAVRAQPVPLYIQDAFKKAALPADANGRWIVQADVNIHRPNGETITGGGELALNGNVLAGNLALKVFEGSYIRDNTMYFNLLKAEPITVRVRHDIAGKPLLGRPAEVARLKNLYTTPFSQGKVTWDSEECSISIYLTPKQVKGTKPHVRVPPPDPIPAADPTRDESGFISAGTRLVKDKKYYSKNQQYTLICQNDGNLVLYRSRPKSNTIYEPLWNTRTYGVVTTCEFQTDGNLVIYRQGAAGWNSRTDAKRAEDKNKSWLDYLPPYSIDSTSKDSTATGSQYWLAVQNDGNLVIYAGTFPKGRAIWASGTAQR